MNQTIKYVLLCIVFTASTLLTVLSFFMFAIIIVDKIEASIFWLIVTAIFLVPTIVTSIKLNKLYKVIKLEKERLAQEQGFINSKEKKFRKIKYNLTHVFGLPFMQGASCTLTSEHNKITIEAQGTVISLDKSKITYIGYETNIEKYTQAVSSVGGAIAGEILLGGIGAAIGGRVKSENFQSVRSYIVITYMSEDENVKYVIFDYNSQAQNLIKDFHLFNNSNIKKQIIEMK